MDKVATYNGKDCAIVGNGVFLPITHMCTLSPSKNTNLNVLVTPQLTKNLLSISKLTFDYPLSNTFIDILFTIQNHAIKKMVATGYRENNLYVLERSHSMFLSTLKNNSLHTSYDIVWYACLGYYIFCYFFIEYKRASLCYFFTFVFLLCVLLIELHFTSNDQHSKNVLDLIYCDIWALLMLYLLQMIVFILFLLLITLVSHGFIP
jgi:hypothetical protein